MAELPYGSEESIAGRAQTYSQQAGNLPNILKSLQETTYGGSEELTGLRGQENAKIQEMYNYDQQLATLYGTPGTPEYVENPVARWNRETQRQASLSQQIGNIYQRRAAIEDVLGNVLESGKQIYLAGLEALKTQIGFEESAADRRFRKEQADKDEAYRQKTLGLQYGDKSKKETEAKYAQELEIFNTLISESETGANFENNLKAMEPQLRLMGIDPQHIWTMYDDYMRSSANLGVGVEARRGVVINKPKTTTDKTQRLLDALSTWGTESEGSAQLEGGYTIKEIK